MSNDRDYPAVPRRSFLKSFALIPAAQAGMLFEQRRFTADAAAAQYTPVFFNQEEWQFLHIACDLLIPHDEHGPGAIELGVPEFIDRHMQTPYAAGDIWYMHGPYQASSTHFGYQGRLPLRDILRVGFRAIDEHCGWNYAGKKFIQLGSVPQSMVLTAAENGTLLLDTVPDTVFFNCLLNEVRNGYFADPQYGGNKGMGAWKMIGYPGLRADYIDWVKVRDRPYPMPPVNLAGKRG